MKISDDSINALLKKGLSQSEIARSCACTRQAINFRIHRERKAKEHLRWARHTKIYWFLIQGLPAEEIAKRIGLTKGSISNLKSKHFPHLKIKPGRKRAGAIQ